jgi:flagellar hook protein FlgE
MIDAISSAVSGLRSSTNQFDNAAQRVVRATTPQTGETAAPSASADELPAAIVDTQMSAMSFKANAAVFKTANKMMGSLLDTIA